MKERVDLNNNGLSIECTVKYLHENKWVHRHVVCKKPHDLSCPIISLFKNKRDKQKGLAKLTFVLQEYVGFESGFTFKKRSNTLCIIVGCNTIVLSFELAESLVIWETWLRNICGHSISFFMQLKRIPHFSNAHAALMKEVCCHIHDSRLAVTFGRTPEVIVHCHLASTMIDIDDHNLITFTLDPENPKDVFIFLCAKSVYFKRSVEAAKVEGALHRMLSRQQLEGDWMPRSQKKSYDHSSQMTVNISELASLMRTPEPTHSVKVQTNYSMMNSLNREKSKSGFVMNSSAPFSFHQPISRANSTAAYYSTTSDHQRMRENSGNSGNYVNISRTNSVRDSPYVPCEVHEDRPETSNYYNFIPPSSQETPIIYETSGVQGSSFRSTSLPEYVNVHLASEMSHEIEGPSGDPDPPRPQTAHAERIRRRSDNSMQNQHILHPSTSKGKSIADFSSPYETDLRHESWRKAKKFFSAFKPKSQSDLLHQKKSQDHRRSITKASSTGALQFAEAVSFFPRSSSASGSESDDIAPALNMTVMEAKGPSLSHLNEDMPPPEGLIRPRSDIQLKARSGVSGILARRLAASVKGSYSKYDGERSTHMYQPQPTAPDPPLLPPTHTAPTVLHLDTDHPPPRPPKPEKFDGIASAVNREQQKLKMSDRRASNVSAHRIHLPAPPSCRDIPSSSKEKHRPDYAPPSDCAPRKSLLTHVTSPRHSNSYSESTRSSNESLSSDARSRISIRKRYNSPPRTNAPILSRSSETRSPAPTLLRMPSSSVDSLNSQQTARSLSPLPLPIRTNSISMHSQSSRRTMNNVDYCDLAPCQAPSSSSTSSVNSRVEYVMIDPVTTRAAQQASSMQPNPFERTRVKSSSMTGMTTLRRKSQGQGSSASDSLSVGQPARQGFFKKYRKMRRNKKNAASMSQLNF